MILLYLSILILVFSKKSMIILTSFTFISSDASRNILAFSQSSSKDGSLSSYVEIISFILIRFCSVLSSFFSASSFLVLYFTIPAASSNSFLLSSDFALKIASILPCPINGIPFLTYTCIHK